MEKVVYVIWGDPSAPGDGPSLRENLLTTLVPALGRLAAGPVQVNVADDAVVDGAGLVQTTAAGPMLGVVSAWVASAIDQCRHELDALVAATPGVGRAAAYLVTESEPMANSTEAPDTSGRSAGFTQVVFLRRPERFAKAVWLDLWLGHHTGVAVATQTTHRYVQNVVARPLTHNAPPIDGIVEETFPTAALNDPNVFFDAVGDKDRFKRNLDAMVESVSSFLDLDDLDVLPTSEYRFG